MVVLATVIAQQDAGTATTIKTGTVQGRAVDTVFFAPPTGIETSMVFNIDSDPINRNWLHWKAWNVPCSDLGELMEFLGIVGKPVADQVRMLRRLDSFYENAPELLRDQAATFIDSHQDEASR